MPKQNGTMASWAPPVGPDGISGPVLMVLRFFMSLGHVVCFLCTNTDIQGLENTNINFVHVNYINETRKGLKRGENTISRKATEIAPCVQSFASL